jgi:nucleoside-diphosphate-sugar epimerase
VLIVGCGDIGVRIARLHEGRDSAVTCLVRSEASAERLRGLALAARDIDLDAALPPLPTAAALVYYLAPPPGTGQTDPRMHRFLEACRGARPARVVYISTTGVYGDCAGAWVDETRPPAPGSERGRRRLDAERALAAFAAETGVETVILRVPGIYGPGRLPIERLREGLVVVCPEEAPPSNRIHADDLARVCLAAGLRGRPGAIYNVSDGTPSSMTEYFYAVADRLGLPRPPCVGLAEAKRRMSPGMWSFVSESRRLDVRRMKAELGVALRYPDLGEGLRASLDADQSLV